MTRRRTGVRRGLIALAGLLVVVNAALAVITNIATAQPLPAWLQSYEGWAWPALFVCVGIVVVLVVADRRSSAEPVAAGEPGSPLVREVSNLRHRNPNFVGRGALLDAVRAGLVSQRSIALVAQPRGRTANQRQPQALHGMPGVGKTELAIEYAHRFRTTYDVVWWIDAERPERIPDQLVALGNRLLLSGLSGTDGWGAVISELNRRDRWLLVIDNVGQPGDVVRYQPASSAGHVLITSRHRGWRSVANAILVDTFDEDESLTFLTSRLPAIEHTTARKLATALGHLPLALAQAASYIEQCGIAAERYLELLDRDLPAILERYSSDIYPTGVAATFELASTQIAGRSWAARQLLHLLAFLAPERIPEQLIRLGADALPQPLAAVGRDELLLDDTVGLLHRFSLVERESGMLRIHRLIQASVRLGLSEHDRIRWARRAATALNDAIGRGGPTLVVDLSSHVERVDEFLRPSPG